MSHTKSCGCDHIKLPASGGEHIEDCPRCGAVAWSGSERPATAHGDALVCDVCGERVIAWMDDRSVTTLRRCLSCDDVVVMSA